MKVVYIAGLAHSGSTFISKVLNQHEDVFSAGELTNFGEEFNKYQKKGRRKISCSCSRRAGRSKCDFWPEIFEFFNSTQYNPEHISRLSQNRRYEWLKACLNRYPPGGKEKFKKGNEELFSLLKEKSGCRIVVDSSKSIWRLLPLSRCFKENLKILHLIKRPGHQLQSRMRRDYNFWHSAIMKYLRKNGLIKLLTRKYDYFPLVFEDFVEQPQEVLKKIYSWLDVPLQDPFSVPPVNHHHLRGHLDAYLNDSPEKINRPDPARLQKKNMRFNQMQKGFISLLEKIFFETSSGEKNSVS